MLVDLTLPIEPGMVFRKGSPEVEIESIACSHRDEGDYTITLMSMTAHTGTHIDVMDKEVFLPPERFIGKGRLFDVSGMIDEDPEVPGGMISEVPGLDSINPGESVFFRTGWERHIREERYFNHPELSEEIVRYCADKKVNFLGIDALGLGWGKNHGKFDALLAERGSYALENLYNLSSVNSATFTVYCFPLRVEGLEAIPVRVVVQQ